MERFVFSHSPPQLFPYFQCKHVEVKAPLLLPFVPSNLWFVVVWPNSHRFVTRKRFITGGPKKTERNAKLTDLTDVIYRDVRLKGIVFAGRLSNTALFQFVSPIALYT